MQLPDTWEPQPQGSDGNDVPMHMFDVAPGSPEYQTALQKFHDTIGQMETVTVVSLKRIQNPLEYRKHVAVEESIADKHHKPKVEVKHLFHGSKQDSIELIAVQGFNRNFAADANGMHCMIVWK